MAEEAGKEPGIKPGPVQEPPVVEIPVVRPVKVEITLWADARDVDELLETNYKDEWQFKQAVAEMLKRSMILTVRVDRRVPR